jgi:hypothetical protein
MMRLPYSSATRLLAFQRTTSTSTNGLATTNRLIAATSPRVMSTAAPSVKVSKYDTAHALLLSTCYCCCTGRDILLVVVSRVEGSEVLFSFIHLLFFVRSDTLLTSHPKHHEKTHMTRRFFFVVSPRIRTFRRVRAKSVPAMT